MAGEVIVRPIIVRDVCAPLEKFSERGLDTESLDNDGNGFVCAGDVYDKKILPAHIKLRDKLFANLFSDCRAYFSKEDAIFKLAALRWKLDDVMRSYSKPFGEASKVAMSLFEYAINEKEFDLARSTFIYAKEKGKGQLGINWFGHSGKISSFLSNSAGEAAGLKVGDKIVSINDIAFTGTYENNDILERECFGKCGEKVTIVVERDGRTLTFEIAKGPH